MIIQNTEGLFYSNNGVNPPQAGMRYFGWSKAYAASTITPQIRFTIAAANPVINITVAQQSLVDVTTADNYYGFGSWVYQFSCDTAGTIAVQFNSASGGGTSGNYANDRTLTTSTRQIDINWGASSGWPAAISTFLFMMHCNRWDYVTVTQL